MKTEEVAPRKPEKNQEVQQVYVTRKKETKKSYNSTNQMHLPKFIYVTIRDRRDKQFVRSERQEMWGRDAEKICKNKKCKHELICPKKTIK